MHAIVGMPQSTSELAEIIILGLCKIFQHDSEEKLCSWPSDSITFSNKSHHVRSVPSELLKEQ